MSLPDNSQIEIRYSFGWAAATYVIPTLILIGYLAYAPPIPRQAHWFMIALLGGASIFGLIVAIRRWTRTEPLFVIGKDGITDNFGGYGLIRWDEITSARLKPTKSGNMLILDVVDPGRFENIKPSLQIRALALKGDLKLNVTETDHDAEDILAEINRRMLNTEK